MTEGQLYAHSKNGRITSMELAKKRTRMAADRTLLAWVRTALSFISFGFTMAKLLGSLGENLNLQLLVAEGNDLGLFLMAVGVLPLVFGMIQYYMIVIEIGGEPKSALLSPSFLMAIVVLLLGCTLFFNVFLKLQLI